jgi:hypothetical protein
VGQEGNASAMSESTKAILIQSLDHTFVIYIELMDATVRLSINRAGIAVDVKLMTVAEWNRFGLPNRYIGKLGDKDE